MTDYEKLGAFYLGRLVDEATGEPGPEDLLYDAKDLTTHAVCVGMTGSGKTGLCLGLLEEAAIDGVPVLAIDPKGDLGNLLLTFPDLAPADFAPWVDPGEALRKGQEPAAYAEKVADLWRNGLAQWGQDGARIRRLRDAADFAIYTPGSTAGLQLTVLKSFAAPPKELADDSEALGERVMASVSSLLAMVGIDADPIQSREHILLSNIVSRAWQAGQDLGLGDLIRAIQQPPFDKVGFFDLDTFFPAKERTGFAMSVNNLLASPGFAAWMEGEPLDIQRLLWTPTGKPRVTILSIAHLSDAQRMFFVTTVLNELVAWMRTQPGTTSLRALLYMDEVFGYFPPTANPPSKLPMLTLLKQARAFGLGCVLATQNPVDLDYKGLSNTGTWFLGRLQTERDKARVLEGLEGASATAGQAFDRAKMEATLARLGSRVFLMNNVHDDAPVLFHTRWVMSYLRGPLTRDQIQTLMADRRAQVAAPSAERAAAAPKARQVKQAKAERPLAPPECEAGVLPMAKALGREAQLVYRPVLLGEAEVHFVSARDHVDLWRDVVCLAPLDGDDHDPWDRAETLEDGKPELDAEPDPRGSFAELPADGGKARSYKSWGTRLKDHLYRGQAVTVWKCKALKEVSSPGEDEGAFRARLRLAARERRDLEVEKLRKKYRSKLARLQERIQAAEHRVDVEKAQAKQQGWSTALSVGGTLLGALFGRKASVSKATTAARRAGRAAKERGDVGRAKEKLETVEENLRELEAEFEQATEELEEQFAADELGLEAKDIRPRKSDTDVKPVRLVWAPWAVGDGKPRPLY